MHVFHAKEPVAETNSEAAPSSLPHELTLMILRTCSGGMSSLGAST